MPFILSHLCCYHQKLSNIKNAASAQSVTLCKQYVHRTNADPQLVRLFFASIAKIPPSLCRHAVCTARPGQRLRERTNVIPGYLVIKRILSQYLYNNRVYNLTVGSCRLIKAVGAGREQIVARRCQRLQAALYRFLHYAAALVAAKTKHPRVKLELYACVIASEHLRRVSF